MVRTFSQQVSTSPARSIGVLTGTLYELQQAGQPKALFGVKAAQNLSGHG